MSQAEVPPEDLAQSVALLTALRDPARPDHTLAMSSLDEHVSNPSFVLVMLHVFANQHAAPCDLRQLAGLIIKNYVFPHLARLPGQVQAALKGRVVQVLQDAEPAIRNTAAILVGKISDSFPVATWSDMLPPILAHLDISQYVQNPIGVEGALAAVQRICEDSALKLGLDEVNRPLDLLIPRLLGLLSCPDKGIRSAALSSYNSLLYLLSSRGQGMGTGGGSPLRSRNSSDNDEEGMGQGGQGQGGQEGWGQGQGGQGGQEGWGQGQGQGQGHSGSPSPSAAVPLLLHMRPFIEALSTLTSDQHAPVRKGVCQAITTIASLHVAALDPYFADICQFMLVALQDSEESVAIEGCEFWAVVLEQPDTKRAMLPALGALVQRLVQRLYLTSEQMESDRIDEEEEAAGEKELNLRPMHHRPSGGEGGELGDDAKENSELSAKWTLRKQAALLLDTVGISFPAQEVLSCALPTIQELFQSQDVLVRESGMLALGALSTGCLEAMLPHLGSIFPFLLQNLRDPLPEMRSIACWVLSRYCGLFGQMGEEEGMGGQGQGCVGQGPNVGKGFYEQSLQALLGAMFDSSAKVQVAACSALCVLVEASFYVPKLRGDNSNGGLDGGVGGGGGGGGGGDGGDGGEENVLIPHLPAILSAVSRAFEAYGARSSLILVDTVGTLADTVREELRGPHLTSLYLPPLMHKLGQLEDFDMRMFPLLECLTSVLSVVGLDAQPYVLSVYHRCITLLGAVVGAYAAAGAGSGGAVAGNYQDLPCKDFAICSLDVVSALSEGLGGAFVGLVNDTQTGGVLLQLMFACIRDDLPELRQSGFSLSGEVCKQSFPLLAAQPESVPQLLSLCISALDTDYPLVCNNAAWTIGELALQVGGAFLQDHVPRAMLCLITALQTAHLPDNLRVNVAVTIGRLAMVDTLEVAELADEYFADWCSVLELPCPTAEKTHAFTGLLSVLHRNPQVLLGNKTHIYSFLAACVGWSGVDMEGGGGAGGGGEELPAVLLGLREVMVGVHQSNPPLWSKVLKKFSIEYPVSVLGQVYRLPMEMGV